MKCPFCGSSQVMVVNSRPNSMAVQIWRRRRCLDCNGIFTTYEKINLSYLTVIKKSGKRVKYKRSKLFAGIYHSTLDKKNVDRGEMGEFSEEITNLVEQKILSLKIKEIQSTQITEMVLGILKNKAFDIFLRFLAYREGGNEGNLKRLLKKSVG